MRPGLVLPSGDAAKSRGTSCNVVATYVVAKFYVPRAARMTCNDVLNDAIRFGRSGNKTLTCSRFWQTTSVIESTRMYSRAMGIGTQGGVILFNHLIDYNHSSLRETEKSPNAYVHP